VSASKPEVVFDGVILRPVSAVSAVGELPRRTSDRKYFRLFPVCASRDKMAAVLKLRRVRGGVAPRVGVLQKIRQAFILRCDVPTLVTGTCRHSLRHSLRVGTVPSADVRIMSTISVVFTCYVCRHNIPCVSALCRKVTR